MNRIKMIFANTPEEDDPAPYSEYIESIHKVMQKSNKMASSHYHMNPGKYYLVFDSGNELNDGNYDSDSILSIFSPYIEKIVWNDPDPLINTERGKVDLFYPEAICNAIVFKDDDNNLSFLVPVTQFAGIKKILDQVEFKKDESEEGIEPGPPGESAPDKESKPSAVGNEKE